MSKYLGDDDEFNFSFNPEELKAEGEKREELDYLEKITDKVKNLLNEVEVDVSIGNTKDVYSNLLQISIISNLALQIEKAVNDTSLTADERALIIKNINDTCGDITYTTIKEHNIQTEEEIDEEINMLSLMLGTKIEKAEDEDEKNEEENGNEDYNF